MPHFQYQATTPQGKVIEGVMEAGEERAVVAWLHDQGYIPLRVSLPAKPRAGKALPQLSLPTLPWWRGVRARD